MNYYEMKTEAEAKWIDAQRIIDHAEKLYERGEINMVEWYEMLASAERIQHEAKEMETIASLELSEYWRAKYLEGYHQELDHRIELAQQAEMRG